MGFSPILPLRWAPIGLKIAEKDHVKGWISCVNVGEHLLRIQLGSAIGIGDVRGKSSQIGTDLGLP